MLIAALFIIGLCLGSFVNALVWRVHEQAEEASKSKPDSKQLEKLSITKGRSMCPHCKHELSVFDLIPVFSWLSLRGKCRYCHKPISVQYPLVELGMALLFVLLYVAWPVDLRGIQIAIFILCLPLVVGLGALLIYDLRWFLLPDRILYPLYGLGAAIAVLNIIASDNVLRAILNLFLAVLISSGIFYALFQFSSGKWIGGGDVKLGLLLGLVVGTPGRSVLLIFSASVIGTVISLPFLLTHKLKRNSVVPFGPLLIAGLVIVLLLGHPILSWYQSTFFPYSV